MGCTNSTARRRTAGLKMPRPVRRAEINGAPDPPKYYVAEKPRPGESGPPPGSVPLERHNSSKRRLTVLHEQEGNSNSRLTMVNDNPGPLVAADVHLEETSGSVKAGRGGGKSSLGIRQIASASMVGYDPNKPRKKNQDNFFGDACFGSREVGFFSVFDGHGMYGELCSDFLVRTLPPLLRKELSQGAKTLAELDKVLKSTFTETNVLLQNHPIDSSLSGSTCCTVLLMRKSIVTANVGDSRCVAAYRVAGADGRADYTARALTTDHKPDLPQEKARILSKGGRVAPWLQSDLDHIYRVWLKDEDTPGIAMSRSFGDQVAAQVGIIAEPECQHYELSPDLAFIVVASDGVWEFMDDQEVVSFLVTEMRKRGRSFHEALDALCVESNERWMTNEGVVDDITALGIVFDPAIAAA